VSREAGTYFYRIYAVNNAGVTGPASEILAVNIGLEQLSTLTSVSAYPNPFDSRKRSVTINFTINRAAPVNITIYDVFGSRIKDMEIPGTAGANDVVWDGTNGSGMKVSKGVYIGVIKVAGDKKIIKIGVIH